jgi:hypothetical protein
VNISNEHLPIKEVFPSPQDFVVRVVKPQQWPPFSPVTGEKRSGLADQMKTVKSHFATKFQDWGNVPAVAKVTLIPAAVAKTYRPTAIFDSTTCPIIGVGKLGELFVSVTPNGIAKVINRLMNNHGARAVAHISTIQSIEPFVAPSVEIQPLPRPIATRAAQQPANRLRCRLFRHVGENAARSEQSFVQTAQRSGAGRVELMNYSEGVRIYCLHDLPADKVEAVRTHPAVEDLSEFPVYRQVRSVCHPRGAVSADVFPAPEPGLEYGIVGLIDSGTDPDNEHLQAWVLDRLDYVSRDVQDNTHGSFVAGLLVHGRLLNHNHEDFPSTSSFIVDVVALDRDGGIDEYDLLTVIDRAIGKFPYVRVWNLSLGRETPCIDSAFSSLGIALDSRMKKHGILFVIAAGNYEIQPFRPWPPGDSIADDADRICPPADASLGVTVGSVAHLDNASTVVKKDEPSPFTRRGPSAAYGTKPEISFPGGNCDKDGRHVQTGIVSIDNNGNVSESIGTSFATPLASTLLANLVTELSIDGEEAAIPLAKAMMFHSALVRNGVPDPNGFRYRGVGTPLDLAELLHCRQSSATVILQVPLTNKPDFAKPFPMPPCLIGDNGLRGEVFMTLYYEPMLDQACDFEYWQSNVDAALGTIRLKRRKDKDPADGFNGELDCVPVGMKKAYPNELEQIAHGFKWSPLKFYYRRFVRGPADKTWEVRLELLNRDGFVLASPVQVYLIVTVRALAGEAQVYNEMVQEMARLGWAANDLKFRSSQRIR